MITPAQRISSVPEYYFSRKLKEVAQMNAEVMGVTSNPYYDAPTYILVFVPADAPNGIQDASLVMENMMLAAHAQGLGSCWIHREREMFATEEGKELMQQLSPLKSIVQEV